MKRMKRLAALFLAAVTALALPALPASAAYVSQSSAQQVLGALNIMTGDASGNYKLGSALTRAEFAKLLIQTSTKRNAVSGSSSYSPYSDVPYTHWAAAYIRAAVSAGYMTAWPDGTFRPSQGVLLEDAATSLLTVMGYSSSDYGADASSRLSFARGLGLLDGVSASAGSSITRGTALYLIYNTLCAKAKNGQSYIQSLGYSTSGDGLDVEDIVASNSAGPIMVTGSSWYSGTGLNASAARVYRNGSTVSLSDLQTYDIVYYSTSLNTVWAYDDKITGVFQSALPSRISPASVVVSGTTYTIESKAAADTLSYSGGLKYGDTITLLMGRNGKVAGVVSAGSSAVYGYMTAAGTKTYTDTGSTVYSYYVSLLLPGGNTVEYQVASDASDYADKVVKLTFSSGTASVSGISSSDLSGKVSASSLTLGSSILASSVRILDVDAFGNGITIYPQRLDGITLNSGSVLLSQTDSSGKITDLILNDVTGDTRSYGVVTKATEVSQSMNLSGSYEYYIGSTSGRTSTSNKLFGLATAGPASFTLSGNSMEKISLLSSLSGMVSFSGTDAVTASDGTRYLLADQVACYRYSVSSGYIPLSLSEIRAYSRAAAYYDKAESSGGRIRVLVVQ